MTPRQLALLMGVDYWKDLSFVLHRLPERHKYFEFEIAKKNGQKRAIKAPIAILKRMQRQLLPLLEELYQPPPFVHGYVRGRSIKTNAERHVGARFVLNIDIQDFFPSIHFTRLEGLLKSPRYGLAPEVARAICQLCCHGGFLPIGAPTSGILSNIVCGPLDSALVRLAKEHRLQYSRYADDITLSASNSSSFRSGTGVHLDGDFIVRELEQVGQQVIDIFDHNRFSINPNKVWATTRSVRQTVTGLVVNRKANIPIEFFRSLRAAIHAVEEHKLPAAQAFWVDKYRKNRSGDLKRNILGRLSYFGSVVNYDDRYTRLAQRVRAIFPEESIYIPSLDTEKAIYVAIEPIASVQATAFHLGDGYFLSVAHMFEKNSEVRVAQLTCPGHFDQPTVARVLQIDFEYDVALLKVADSVAAEGRPAISIGQRRIVAGDNVRVLGFPQYDEGNTCSVIEVQVTGTRVTLGKRRVVVDKNLAHGLSGGPVFAPDGVCSGLVFSGASLGSADAPLAVSFTPFEVFRNLYGQWRAQL